MLAKKYKPMYKTNMNGGLQAKEGAMNPSNPHLNWILLDEKLFKWLHHN